VRSVELVFAVGWAAFWVSWVAAGFFKKSGRHQWSRELRIRVVLIVFLVVLVRLGVFRGGHHVTTDPWREALGLALFALGLAFAIWARVHIGRNWGHPMTQKDEPELVTSGPYHFARHPIYSGILGSLLKVSAGTPLVASAVLRSALLIARPRPADRKRELPSASQGV